MHDLLLYARQGHGDVRSFLGAIKYGGLAEDGMSRQEHPSSSNLTTESASEYDQLKPCHPVCCLASSYKADALVEVVRRF